ncbi:TIM barrel protein [Nocardia sp. NPDC003963]
MSASTAPRAKAIATVCLSGTLEDKLVAAAHAGFDGIELFEPDLLGSELAPAQIRARCAELGLDIVLYQPFRDLDSTDPDRFAANLRRFEHKLEIMATLGTDTVLVCSSVGADAVADPGELARQLAAAGDIAGRRGIRIAYEALAWGREVNTWSRSWDVVRRAAHPAVGLCLDSFHILSREPSIDGIAGVPGEKIFFLQLADASAKEGDVLQWSRHHRLFPGEGSFDLPSFVRAVLATGYTGPLSLEVFNDVFRQAAPVRTAVDAMRSLRVLDMAVAGTDAAPAAVRAAFVEVSVTPDVAGPVRNALSGLGFARAATHRSKDVTAWTQADAAVLLTVSADSSSDSTASLAAIAFEIEAPGEAAAHARAVLADPLPRVVGPGESPLPAVSAPDGTAVFYVSGAGGEFDWRRDFVATGVTGGSRGITGIDHISTTPPFDRYAESLLFYRSVAALTTADVSEYPGPYGLVRSTLLRGAAGTGPGVALDGPLLRRGKWSPGVRTPQHIAFTTTDIFATLSALGDEAPMLPIPDNYYADLAARFQLEPRLLRELRRYGILYDRTGTGEYLHAYTTVFGGQLYFELVDRRGNYPGRPAANAPIRMAAHVNARRGRPAAARETV